MKPFLLGKKIGMTQMFQNDGTVLPVTILQAGPCVVTQVKSVDKDGYQAVQIGFGAAGKLSKPATGHQKASKQEHRHLREVRLDQSDTELPKVGSELDVQQFEAVKQVTVSAISKGKGFAGVIKRHGFHRGPETHGSDHHRKPGSIGGMFPQRVLKGQKLPGHLGHVRTTVKGLDVVAVDTKNHTLALRGSIPGPKNSIVEIVGNLS